MSNLTPTELISFSKFYHRWHTLKPENNVSLSEEELWIRKTALIEEMSLQNNVVVFLFNTYTNKFVYMSDRLKLLTGLDASSYLNENGLNFSFSRMHPGQIEAITHFHIAQVNFLQEGRSRGFGYNDMIVCLNYLYKNGKNEYEQVFQRTGILEFDPTGLPLIAINIIHYIAHVKKANSVGCACHSPEATKIFEYDEQTKSVVPVIISEQEKKVIELLAKGYDSKTIAQKLSISPNTADTHRRNILKKTNCIDTTGVVLYSRLVNLI